MNKAEIKELTERYKAMTLGELKGIYSEKVRINILHKESIRENAQKLVDLDFEDKYYTDRSKALMNDISFYKSYIKDDEADLKLIKPILDKKQAEGLNEEGYQNYISNNVNIKVLIDAVEKDKQQFIKEGHKILIPTKNRYQDKEIVLPIEQVNQMYDTMLIETIFILKDNIGNLKQVDEIKGNGNRGFDGYYTGEKGSINIRTIIAGGYNIQKAHFRTLVYQYNK